VKRWVACAVACRFLALVFAARTLTRPSSCESETFLSQHVEHRDTPNP